MLALSLSLNEAADFPLSLGHTCRCLLAALLCTTRMRGLFSKGTLVLRQWESETRRANP